ncbi:anaphase-promoting complex subunit 7 [Drosophila hydei]|uniref:Anaphase-promoting complex subunit 7 n=1 Tax=Drosophila hydei TaxID=7224 RepID=A0A6J1LSY2_DROHY|nr:anaphase-promoting complex subunit 7 [Drosophila hydei]
MENALCSNIKKLYDNGLYECVIPTASLLCTLLKNDRNVATLEMEYQAMIYLSNANYKEHNYRTACSQLEAVVVQRKTMLRFKSSFLTAIESSYPQFQDVELRYKIAICYREMGEYNMAINTLQAVKTRTPRVNMLLARLLHHHGHGVGKKEKALAYKDVLRECPMSLTSIEALLELGIEGSDVHSMVVNAAALPKNIEWLSSWIKGHAQMYGCKHREASQTFQQLNESNQLHQNEHVLTKIGQCLYYDGNYLQAEQYLSLAMMQNPHNMKALCPLAVVYDRNKKKLERSNLLAPLEMRRTREFRSSHWFLHAQQTYSNAKYERALSFTERALDMDERNIEALLLRAGLYFVLQRQRDAVNVFQNIQCLAPYRFEVYKGLVACYVRLNCIKEAQATCTVAVRQFPTSARSFTMFGGTLFRLANPNAVRSAKRFVEKGLQIDEHYAPGIALLASIYQGEGDIRKAIVLLKKQVEYRPDATLFAMLAEMFSKEKDLDAALQYFTLSLRLDSTYQRALDGINALTKAARIANSHKANGKSNEPNAAAGANAAASAATATAAAAVAASAAAAASASCNVPSMTRACNRSNHDWLLDYDEAEPLELSSPAGPAEDAESDAFAEPFWQAVDSELTN